MRPVHQDKFGKPHGNCFAACIASILEIGLHDVPAEFHGTTEWEEDDLGFFDAVNEWLGEWGLFLMVITCENPEKNLPKGWLIIGGTSPRGIPHCVVGYGHEMKHDPHPDNTGLTDTDVYYLFVSTRPNEAKRWAKRKG